MRHAKQNQRLSLPGDHRTAVLNGLVKSLVTHGRIKTSYTRAKEAQRLADRLVTLGKEGSIHSRRRAFRVLQDRTLVKQLFTEIAPRYVDISGGYTRVLRLGIRKGDGAQRALLALSRLPAEELAVPAAPKPAKAPKEPTPPKAQPSGPAPEAPKKRGFFEGLRGILTQKKPKRVSSGQ